MDEKIDTLLITIIQAQDADIASNALHSKGFSIGKLPSAGGFLGRRNITLLIGSPASQQPVAINTLNENCRQRIEYIAVPLESAPLPLPAPTPITVGGATVFSIPVDRYEEV